MNCAPGQSRSHLRGHLRRQRRYKVGIARALRLLRRECEAVPGLHPQGRDIRLRRSKCRRHRRVAPGRRGRTSQIMRRNVRCSAKRRPRRKSQGFAGNGNQCPWPYRMVMHKRGYRECPRMVQHGLFDFVGGGGRAARRI